MQKDFSKRLTSVDFSIDPTYKPLPIRTDLFLKTKFPKRSRNQLKKVFEEHRVLVNDKPVSVSHKLRGGECIRVLLSPDLPYISPAEMDLEVLYEDNAILAINKAPGVMTHPAGSVLSGTLLNKVHHLFEERGESTRPGVLQRLDKDTSGLLLWAKTNSSHVHLQSQIVKHSIYKIYLAICEGVPKQNTGKINAPVAEVSHPFQKKMGVDHGEHAKHALTEYIVLATSDRHALVGIRLHTGRQHQIRVHMEHIGHPLAGDHLYGGSDIMSRQALHSYASTFVHPESQKETQLIAPLPEDFHPLMSVMHARSDIDTLNMSNKSQPWNPHTWTHNSHKCE